MVLDEHGGLFTFGSGASGALGHGDTMGQEFPVKIMEFGKSRIQTNILLDCVQILNFNYFLSCYFKNITMFASIK